MLGLTAGGDPVGPGEHDVSPDRNRRRYRHAHGDGADVRLEVGGRRRASWWLRVRGHRVWHARASQGAR